MTVSELCHVIAGLRLSGERLQAVTFLSLFSVTLAEERLGIVMISLRGAGGEVRHQIPFSVEIV